MPQLNLNVPNLVEKKHNQNIRIVKLFFDCFSYTCVGKGQRQNYGNYVD